MPRRLLRHLGAFEDVRVIPDPQAAGPVDPWRVHRVCLESLPEHASHLLILQDDAVPAEDFAGRLIAAIAAQPEAVLCAFTPGFAYLQKQLAAAKSAGHAFSPLRVGAFVPCVAICYPRAFIAGLLDWVDHRSTSRQRTQLRGADDGVLAIYCRHARVQPLLLVPPIVEHDASIQSIGKLHRRSGPHRSAALV